MPKDCVINELSIEDFGPCGRDALELLATLDRLRALILPARLWMWDALRKYRQEKTPENLYFEAFVTAARRCDPDRARRLLRLFDKAVDFEDDAGEEVHVNIPSATKGIARGVGRARQLGALALSISTANHWICHTLPVTVIAFAQASDTLEERLATVRHAALAQHVDQHRDWEEFSDTDRLRARLATFQPAHKPASEYRKHVCGTTNEERAGNARGPGGVGQYLAERDGAPVTDETIRQWEERALDRVRNAGEYRLEDRGSVVWIFCDLGETVGYAGGADGDGGPTPWVRVELSAGTVHSHPRLPPPEAE